MPSLNILITGAGIAGPVAAYWLHKANPSHRITIVERSASPRKTGQSIDIRGPAVKIVEEMGLLETVRSFHTTEKGIQKLGQTGNVLAQFDASGDQNRQSMTSEFEILRGDLANVFAKPLESMETVQTVYGEYVKGIEQRNGKAHVTFMNGRPQEAFDLIVAADGMSSRTRSMVTGRPAREDLKPVGGFITYFTMPPGNTDSPTHARLYNATGGRSLLLRPTTANGISAYMMMTQPTKAEKQRLEGALSQGLEQQQALTAEIFTGAGWETERVTEGMYASDDFYFQEISQVHVDSWAYDCVALLGDAGYCPSPLTGAGTSSAIYGAYILAGELMRQEEDVPEALKSYEKVLRPYVENVQKIIPLVPRLANPTTATGITVLNMAWYTGYNIYKALSWTGLTSLLSRIPLVKGESQALPLYVWP